MRLLNVETRRLQEFFVDVPQYVILSHTWGNDEVTFQDLDRPDHIKKRGYLKIDGTCCLAAQNGINAELSEAINSMYKWYKDSSTCYVYLEDVQQGDDLSSFDIQFSNSRWFTRGWTLQELLTPETVEFFDAAWKKLGTRSSLALKIESITSIPAEFLERNEDSPAIRSAKIAMRMSWAARRQTTRLEDRAYCLLGIFNANMPLLYGEGERAFERLQIEIMKQSSDDSILAWARKGERDIYSEKARVMLMKRSAMMQSTDGSTLVPTSESEGECGLRRPHIELTKQPSDNSIASSSCRYEGKPKPANLNGDILDFCRNNGVLARCPDDFAWWTSIQSMDFYDRSNFSSEMTTRGLHVTLPVFKVGEGNSYGVLNCMVDNSFDQILAIRLHHTGVVGEYERTTDGLVTLPWQVVRECQQMAFCFLNPDQQRLPHVRSLWNNGGQWTVIRIQGPDDRTTRLVRIEPKFSCKREGSLLFVRYIHSDMKYVHSEHWPRILLHYKKAPMDDEQDDGSNEDGFVVVFDKRASLRAFPLQKGRPPFVCYTIPMQTGEELEHLVPDSRHGLLEWRIPDHEHCDLSKLRNGFSLKAGVPQAKIEREKFLDQERFLVKIYHTKSLAQHAMPIARTITNLRPLMDSKWTHGLHRRVRLCMSEAFVILVPYVAWNLNSKSYTVNWKEDFTCVGLVLLALLFRYKTCLIIWSSPAMEWMDWIDSYLQTLDLVFAVVFPVSMYTFFPRTYNETKVNPLVSVICSMAVILWAKRGQRFFESQELESTTDETTDDATDNEEL